MDNHQTSHRFNINTTGKNTTTSSAKNRFKELKRQIFWPNSFYTDGSKTVDRTGAAVTNINNYKQIRLLNIASIYLAELQEIKMALDMINNSEMG